MTELSLPILYGHPFSSYCQKVLIALYEADIAFSFRQLGADDGADAEWGALWPLKKMPVLVEAGRPIVEASIIIEHLQHRHSTRVRLIPETAAEALETRFMDRIFDNYVMTPMQKIVVDQLRPAGQSDVYGVTEARTLLDASYAWLDQRLADRTYSAGADFTLADCAAGPALFYADWAHPIDAGLVHLRAYRARLLARPSFARAIDEARPYRSFFPLGAPNRD